MRAEHSLCLREAEKPRRLLQAPGDPVRRARPGVRPLCSAPRPADKAAVRVPLRHVRSRATASFAESCSPRSGSLGRHLSRGGGCAIRLAVTLHGPLP